MSEKFSVLEENELPESTNGDVIISVKVDRKEEIFSKYNYNSDDVLNKDFIDYVWHKAELVPMHKDLSLEIYTNENISVQEVETSIKSYCKAEYTQYKNQLKRYSRFSFICLILGIITLLALSLAINLFNKSFAISIIEILSWVFVWEAFDVFFFQRWNTRLNLQKLKKMYSASISIVTINKLDYK